MTTSNGGNIGGQSMSSSNVKAEAQQHAARMSEQAKQQARQRLDQGKETISAKMEKVAHAARAAASDLDEQDQSGLSTYVSSMADSLNSFAGSLRDKNADELVHQVTGMARRNPGLFIAGSIAVGFGISRFAKASSKRSQSTSDSPVGYRDTYTDSTYTGSMGDYEASAYEGSGFSDAQYSDLSSESAQSLSTSDDYEATGYTDTSYDSDYQSSDYNAADYSDRDFPSSDRSSLLKGSGSTDSEFGSSSRTRPLKDKQSIATERLRPDDKSSSNDLGGKRYE